MANELRMPIEEAEDCLNDLLEMEREELDPVREAKVIAACRDMVGQWDKEMRRRNSWRSPRLTFSSTL